MKNLNVESLFTGAFKDVWKAHKWAVMLLFKPMTYKTSSNSNTNSNNQKPVSVSSSLEANKSKKSNSNRVQLSSNLSTKLNNR